MVNQQDTSNITNLDFDFPADLVAMKPHRPSRVLYSQSCQPFQELNLISVLEKFRAGDVLVLNNSKVEKRCVKGQTASGDDVEVLFVLQKSDMIWQVLCPLSKIKKQIVHLPENITFKIIEGGRPQLAEVSQNLSLSYFEKYGQMPLPPYIQKQRKNKSEKFNDDIWYQNPWGKMSGSSASPTASLHFSDEDLIFLKKKGVKIVEVTLHVGFATYLPLDHKNDYQKMHSEWCCVPKSTIKAIKSAIKSKRRVAALGTTVVRAIESLTCGMLKETKEGFIGETDLFISQGHKFQWINCLLTNFHRPRSSLLALLVAFAGRNRVMEGYKWAIDRKFQLFSYGDLSVWDQV